MAKTRDDEIHEKGVQQGQRGGFLDDLVMGNIPAVSKDEKIFKDGYTYGAQHRYGKEGRFHTWNGKGSNDPKSKESKETKESEKADVSSGESYSSSDYGDSYSPSDYGDRHYHGYDPKLSTGGKWFICLAVVAILGAISSIFLEHNIKLHFPSKEVKQAWNLEYIAKYGEKWERAIAIDKLKKYNGKYDNNPYIKKVKEEREKELTRMWNKKSSLEYLSQFKDPEIRKKAEQWLITYYDAVYGANCKDLSSAARLRCFAATNQLKSRGKTKPSGVRY